MVQLYMRYNSIQIAPLNVDDVQITSEAAAKNCHVDTYYCTSDNDCNDICGTKSFICNASMKCAPRDLKILDSESSVNCNLKHGGYLALAVNEIEGAHWTCLNKYPNLFESRGNFHKHVCNSGSFQVNTLVKAPTVSDCTCRDSSTRVIKSDDPNTPRCASKANLKLFKSLYEDE